MAHPLFTLLAAAVVAGATQQNLRPALRSFAWCMASVVAGGWLMYWIHG